MPGATKGVYEMKHHEKYKAVTPAGWDYVDAGDLPHTHIFQSGNNRDGFRMIECSDDCLTNGDLAFMAKHGLTCDKNRLADLSARIAQRNGLKLVLKNVSVGSTDNGLLWEFIIMDGTGAEISRETMTGADAASRFQGEYRMINAVEYAAILQAGMKKAA